MYIMHKLCSYRSENIGGHKPPEPPWFLRLWREREGGRGSGLSKAGPSRAGTLLNIQSAHPTPLAKNLGLNINLPVFYILASAIAKKTLGLKVNLEHISDVLK